MTVDPQSARLIPSIGNRQVLESNVTPDQRRELTAVKRGFHRQLIDDIGELFKIHTFRPLILSMVLVWSFDESNFLFLTDLVKSSGHDEQRSTLIIAVIGVADLIGQLLFG
jgi:hypothetical protein